MNRQKQVIDLLITQKKMENEIESLKEEREACYDEIHDLQDSLESSRERCLFLEDSLKAILKIR